MNNLNHHEPTFLSSTSCRGTAGLAWFPNHSAAASDGAPARRATVKIDPVLAKDWLARWERNILSDARNRYCDRETGEAIGWLVSPFLNGFYHGYQATGDAKWVAHLAAWADAWIKRGVKEPDGFIGWPKQGSGGVAAEIFLSDSLLGEAMGLRPLVLVADEIAKVPALREKLGPQAEAWLKLSGQMFKRSSFGASRGGFGLRVRRRRA